MELQFKNVTKDYGDVHAVDHVTYSMEKGVYGLLGVNGAGKSTLMRMLCTAGLPGIAFIRKKVIQATSNSVTNAIQTLRTVYFVIFYTFPLFFISPVDCELSTIYDIIATLTW